MEMCRMMGKYFAAYLCGFWKMRKRNLAWRKVKVFDADVVVCGQTSEGVLHEAPRRVLVEGAPGAGKTTLALRVLHAWAARDDRLGGPAVQLALFVPLRELRGSSLAHYLGKELLPKSALAPGGAGAGSGSNGFAHIWKCLGLLEDRLLFVLDGYDEAVALAAAAAGQEATGAGAGAGGAKEALGDAVDLLEGRLFPECRVLVTCSPAWSAALLPLVQRRVVLRGMDWAHVERLVHAYFASNHKPESASRFLEEVSSPPSVLLKAAVGCCCACWRHGGAGGVAAGLAAAVRAVHSCVCLWRLQGVGSPQVLRPLAAWPLGWLLLCVLFEESGGRLPSSALDVHQALFKCLIRRSLERKGDSPPPPPAPPSPSAQQPDLPGHCKKLLAEFGKLALACIKAERFVYTDAEIRAHCRGGGLDATELGFLTRGLNFGRSYNQKKRADFYSPLVRSFADFLAAYYVSSVVHYANILRRELEDLPGCVRGNLPQGKMPLTPVHRARRLPDSQEAICSTH
ncbi:Uncharacterized protein GBIM_20550 [Gryllus bimaculatus]|nr:Uncharacterized protein GBIM_20550 [Gryllus bimaculatus]